MQENLLPQKNKPEKTAQSVFAKEKTYGERKHAFIFGTMINFWVNLLASAGFTFWVAHSTRPIKLPFVQDPFVPREVLNNLGNWIEKQSFMQSIKNPVTRTERSHSMATLFALLTPGHVIMIPSVYFGAKYKSAIVNYFDRKHYGDEAMDSMELKSLHDAIENEDRPTVLGAIVSRIGSFFATQLTGRLIGTPDNFINKLGAKDFRGIDPVAIDIGGSFGEGLHKVAPKTLDKINASFTKKGYDWSATQRRNPAMAHVMHTPYNQAVDNVSRYVTQDVLYTLVTSSSVHPILNFAKKYIPGLTYKPSKHKPAVAETPRAPVVVAREEAQEGPEAAALPLPKDIPDAKVSQIQNESTLMKAPEQSLAPAGA